MPFGDETYKIVLNTACSPEKVPEKLRPLYKYIRDAKEVGDDALVRMIDDRVRQYNSSEWRRKFMTFEQELKDRYRDGFEEGKEQEAKNIAANMKAKGIDFATISEVTGLSESEITTL